METVNRLPAPRQRDLYRRMVGVLAKRWWAIAIVFIVIVSGAVVWLARAPRVYEAKASVIIDSATPQVLGGQFRDVVDVEMGAWWSAREYIQTQYSVIKSESLSSEVAHRLESTGDLPKLNLGTGEAARERASRLIFHIVQVEPVKDSRIVNIGVRYTDREVCALLANAVADAYIDQNLERRLSSTRGAASWLDGQLGELKRKLEDSELALYSARDPQSARSRVLRDDHMGSVRLALGAKCFGVGADLLDIVIEDEGV